MTNKRPRNVSPYGGWAESCQFYPSKSLAKFLAEQQFAERDLLPAKKSRRHSTRSKTK